MELTKPMIRDILYRFCDDFGWDYCAGYGEPGYDTDATAVVLGSYWLPKSDPLRSYEDKWPRLWRALEDAGVSFEWYDEWVIDHHNGKAYRWTPDSYSWVPSIVFDDSGEILTPDDDIDTWLEYAVNDVGRCLFDHVHSEEQLRQIGFRNWPNDTEVYETGWHHGQDSDPREVTRLIRAEHGESVDIVFLMTGKGQWDARWVAMIRPTE